MSLRMSSYYRPCTKIYRQRLMMRFRGKIGNNVQFWHYCVYVYLGCKWAPSAPVWWLDGRRVHSRAPQRCPGPSVWFDACRGTKRPDQAWKRSACSWPRWKRSACSQGSGSLHVFTEIPQRLEKSICAKIQSIQMKYTWLDILHQSAVVTEIMKI